MPRQPGYYWIRPFGDEWEPAKYDGRRWWLIGSEDELSGETVEVGEAVAKMKTLRDEFAIAALTGMLSANRMGHVDKEAERAYAFAEAMLAAREAKA